LYRRRADATLLSAVTQPRLRSSFIYLANAVNDLRGNWAVLAIVLAPLVLAAALCLLPDAINLQNRLVFTFEPGTQSIRYDAQTISYHRATPIQEPYAPAKSPRPDTFPSWFIISLHFLLLAITEGVVLVTMCMLSRIHRGAREPTKWSEAVATLSSAAAMTPSFYWVSFLKLAAPVLAVELYNSVTVYNPTATVVVLLNIGLLVALAGAFILYMWLYFSQFALVFNGQHSFHALLYSRDLMRKRFFTVAIRILVFVAVNTGYNSIATIGRIVASVLIGPIGIVVTGSIWGAIFVLNLIAFAVLFATASFFTAAGFRLYQDLLPEQQAAMLATGPTANGQPLTAPAHPAPQPGASATGS
jgi:hypothetical protein